MKKDTTETAGEKASREMREWLDGLASKEPAAKRARYETGTMIDLLRQAIIETDNLLAISKATGLDRASLRRFRDGERTLRLDMAVILAEYFGIECRRKR